MGPWAREADRTGLAARREVVPLVPPDPAPDTPRPPGLWDRLRGRTGDEPSRPSPWRVEGMPDRKSSGAAQRPGRGGFWLWVGGFLVINWILMSVLMGPPSRATVSYTFFTDQ